MLDVIKRRDRIHRLKSRWTEQDRTIFAWSGNAAYSLFIARQDEGTPTDFASRMHESVEVDGKKLVDVITD